MEQGVAVTHSLFIPVRHQAHFQGRDLDDLVDDHHLFALPGPAFPGLNPEPELGPDGDDMDDQQRRTEPIYRVLLDVSPFRAEDILIQVFEGWLLIRARHGARMDEHGSVSRSFTREFPLPEKLRLAAGADLRALLCHDGVLVVESKERAIEE